jgi:hypothetical protein
VEPGFVGRANGGVRTAWPGRHGPDGVDLAARGHTHSKSGLRRGSESDKREAEMRSFAVIMRRIISKFN